MNRAIAPQKQTRLQWHIGYYCLAAFNVFAVVTSVYLGNRITTIYQSSVAINQQWAQRRNHISELGPLASKVNAPGNNVFESRNVVAESQRMRTALTLFSHQINTIQAELYRNVHPDVSAPILAELQLANRRMTEMVNEADLIFAYFQQNQPSLAGERMAIMDQKFASLTEALHNLEAKVSQVKLQLLEQQAGMAKLMQKLEYVVAILVLTLVSGVIIYGHKIAKQTRSQEAAIQHYIQELQQTQTQLIQTEKMSSLGHLVAGIAHEINNPVSFIHGNLSYADGYMQDLLELIYRYQVEHPNPSPSLNRKIETIDLDFLRDDLPKLFTSMRVGTERIRDIVRSLRNFSHIDEAEIKRVDIHEGIDSTLMILQHRLKSTSERPEILVLKNYGYLPTVECYPGLLNQVFMNLLTNAIDALDTVAFSTFNPGSETPSNNLSKSQFAPCIHICTKKLKGDRVSIQITDNGSGIPEAVRAKLFDPFFTTKPVGKGTGLGLSVSYQIVVEQHGGQLRYQPKSSQGAEFVIEIPIHQPSHKPSGISHQITPLHQPKAASI